MNHYSYIGGNSASARVFAEIGAVMDKTAAIHPPRELYPSKRPRKYESKEEIELRIRRLMERLNTYNAELMEAAE